jgi:hypothetical protein
VAANMTPGRKHTAAKAEVKAAEGRAPTQAHAAAAEPAGVPLTTRATAVAAAN